MMMNSQKWACERCTYENWPVSTRCSLCLEPRPQQLITADRSRQKQVCMTNTTSSTATIDMINDSRSSSPSIYTEGLKTIESGGKWACPSCTYVNWPKSQSCVQCYTLQQKYTLSPSVEESASDTSQCIYNSSGKISPQLSTDNSTQIVNNDKNRSCTARSMKWVCQQCTYENWARSSRCTICHQSRPKSPEPGVGQSSACSSSSVSSSDDNNKRRNCSGRRRSPPTSAGWSPGETSIHQIELAMAAASAGHTEQGHRLRQIKNRMRKSDWLFLNACIGVVEGDQKLLEAYLSAGGDRTRQLNNDEVNLLNRPSAFDVGFTLVHLAIRFKREDMLAVLLTTDISGHCAKRVPSQMCPEIASEILQNLASSLRQRKGDFGCYVVNEMVTFTLPADICDFPRHIKKQVMDEILDRDVQKELEIECPIINWSIELRDRMGSRLYALWNRTAGDCLLDSVLQATWGIFDINNILRRALAETLCDAGSRFYMRWKEYEMRQALLMNYALDETQCEQDWAITLSLATQPGMALEQLHIFVLAHILRRPIIVYGVKLIKSFRGDTLGHARFEGVYLPLLWEASFCWKSPIALGYTRGHFSALVPMEMDTCDNLGAEANIDNDDEEQMVYLPLTDFNGKLLPFHFLSSDELGTEERLLQEWLECCVTDGGLQVAQQKVTKRPALVSQMLDKWLDRYRKLVHRRTLSDGNDD